MTDSCNTSLKNKAKLCYCYRRAREVREPASQEQGAANGGLTVTSSSSFHLTKVSPGILLSTLIADGQHEVVNCRDLPNKDTD